MQLRLGLPVVVLAALSACGAETGSGTLRIQGQDDDPVQDHLPEAALVEPDPYDIVAPQGVPLSRRDLLVIFEDDATVGPANALIASLGASIAGGLPDLGIVQLRVPVAEATGTDEDLRPLLEARAALKASPLVAAVTLNWFYPTERLPPHDRAAPAAWAWARPWPPPPADGSGPWGLKAIRMPQAWNLADHAARKSAGLPRPAAGILEGGVDPTLADLSPRVDLPAGATVDPSGHASQVAGIIAASWGNRVGIDGIAPIEVAIRARDTAGRLTNALLPGYIANTAFANNLLELLRDPTVRVINASVGNSAGYEQRGHDPVVHGLCPPPLCDTWRAQMDDDGYWLLRAVQTFKASASARSNFLITCSAGNARLRPGTALDFESRDNSPCCNVAVRGVGDPTLPGGGAGADHFLAVEATNASGDRAYFSSGLGSVSAPGEDVFTTGLLNGYLFNRGTSFSAPHVAGLALYLWTLDPDLRHSDVRRALTDPLSTVAVPAGPNGGAAGARSIDAFAAALAIDDIKGDVAIRTALVDVDDGTPDGNLRVARDVHGVATGEDPTFHAPDGRRGDGRVSIADLRAFRDALTQVQLADGTLGPGLAALDGELVYAKRDLNGDGCVGVNPVPGSGVPDCAGAQPEATWSRFDFNGDGVLDRHGVAKVRGQDKTDLQVLADLWPADEALTDGWAAAALEHLVPDGPVPLFGSADIAIGTALPLGPNDPHDELRLTFTAPTRAITRSLRGPGPPVALVLTIPNDVAIEVKVEGYKAGVKVGDLCALIAGGIVTEVPPSRIGEDVALELGPCTRGPSFKATGRWWAFSKYDASTAPEIGEVRTLTYDDHRNPELFPQSLQTDEKACANLSVGQSCAYEHTLERTYASATVEAEVTRVAAQEWVVEATMVASAKQPPVRPPPGTTCEDASISANCWSASEGGFTLEGVVDIQLPAPAKRRLRITCRAAGDEPPQPQLGYTQLRVRDTLVDIGGCASPSVSDAVAPGWSVDGEHVVDGDAVERLFLDFRLSVDVVAEYQHDSRLPQNHLDYEGQVKVTMSLLHIVVEDLP